MYLKGTGLPVKHGRVILVPFKKWLVQCTLLYTGQIRYQKHTAMFNWSPCMVELISGSEAVSGELRHARDWGQGG